MKIKIQELRDLILKALNKHGYTDEEAPVIADILLYTQFRGVSHGVVKLLSDEFGKNPEAGEPQLIKETTISALIDGAKGSGIFVMNRAVDIALSKALEHGIAIVGTNNTFASTGALGYYVERLSAKSLVGIALSSSPETVPPHGSSEAVFGTNPIAISIPTLDEPLTLDMATAAMPFFAVMEAKFAGKTLPEGIGYDKAGNSTTDPGAIVDSGSINPFDFGPKGAGLAMMFGILAGPLVGAAALGSGETWKNWGNLIIAIDPKIFGDLETFKKAVTDHVTRTKSAKRLPGVEEIFVPGERSSKKSVQAQSEGMVEIGESIINGLREFVGE